MHPILTQSLQPATADSKKAAPEAEIAEVELATAVPDDLNSGKLRAKQPESFGSIFALAPVSLDATAEVNDALPTGTVSDPREQTETSHPLIAEHEPPLGPIDPKLNVQTPDGQPQIDKGVFKGPKTTGLPLAGVTAEPQVYVQSEPKPSSLPIAQESAPKLDRTVPPLPESSKPPSIEQDNRAPMLAKQAMPTQSPIPHKATPNLTAQETAIPSIPVKATPLPVTGNPTPSAIAFPAEATQILPAPLIPNTSKRTREISAPAPDAPLNNPTQSPKQSTVISVATPIQPITQMQAQDGRASTLLSADTDPQFLPRAEGIGPHNAPQTQAIATRMDLPQHVARQVAEAMAQMPNRPVEISLNPAELGRVRLAVSSSEAGIVVNVLAERPETIDLMRRHINTLEAAFQDIGYSDIAFSFSGGQAEDGAGNDQEKTASFGAAFDPQGDADAPAQIDLGLGAQAGLDIRL